MGLSPGSSRFVLPAESDQLLCLPEPLMPSKGFSCCRHTRPWWLARRRIFSMVSRFSSMARLALVKMGASSCWAGATSLCFVRAGHAERPQLVVELLHELVHRRADSAEVVLFQLLALAGRIAEQRAAAHDEVLALGVVLFRDQEIFLLGTHRGNDALVRLAEQREHAVRLLFHHVHGAEERRLLVERLARVAAEGCGDAQHLVFDEGVAGGVPRGVAAGLEGGAQAAGGEGWTRRARPG